MNVLEAQRLDLTFPANDASRTPTHAVNDVSLHLEAGEFAALVGGSGSGKSTVARVLMGLQKSDAGTVRLCGEEVSYPYPRSVYQNLQMVFQLPQESFNPRQTLGGAVTFALRNFGYSKREARNMMLAAFANVGLDESYAAKYPHQVSGGECQRAAIARALVLKPAVLICDEVTSALDAIVQAQVINVLADAGRSHGCAVLFISHDIALVHGLCDRIMVMHDGSIVEQGAADQVVAYPQDPYTKELLEAVVEP